LHQEHVLTSYATYNDFPTSNQTDGTERGRLGAEVATTRGYGLILPYLERGSRDTE
jgi:hypothetical protein